MTVFEHKIDLHMYSSNQFHVKEYLDSIGVEGWELVHYETHFSSTNSAIFTVWKRAKP